MAAPVSERFTTFLTRHPGWIVMTFLVLCVAAVFVHLRQAHYDFSFESMSPRDTLAFERWEEFREIFGDDEGLYLIAFSAHPLVTNENLDLIARITARVEALDDTETVNSLTNVLDIRAAEQGLDVSEFVGERPLGDDALRVLEGTLTADPIVAGTLISDDARTTAIVVRMNELAPDPNQRILHFEEVERILAEEGGGRVAFHLSGIPYFDAAMMTHINGDTARFIPYAIGLLGVMMWLAFGQVRAVWMSVTPIAIAATLTLGTLSLLDYPMSLLTGQGVLATLIMVIGLSDAVHFVNRYGEDVAARPGRTLADRYGALADTVRHIGSACFLTSLTTAVGFVSLTISGIPTIREFGLFGALGIGYAYLGAILFLPAGIVLSERVKISDPRPPGGNDLLDRVLCSASDLVVRAPRALVLASVLILAAAAACIPRIVIDNRFTRDMFADDPAVVSMKFLEENISGTYPLEIVVEGHEADAIKIPEVLAAADTVRAAIEDLPYVSKVSSPVAFIKKMNRAMHEGAPDAYALPATSDAVAQYLLLFEMAGGDNEFDRLVDYDYSVARMSALLYDISPEQYYSIIDRLHESAAGQFPPGVEVYESGTEPLFFAATERLISTLMKSLFFAMPIIFVITGIVFRSARLAVISVLPNILPLMVGMGILGLAGISLRFTTLIAFPVAFGIAVDDTIHFLARYQSETARGRDMATAIRNATRTAGRAMVLTTVFLVAGYGTLFWSNFLGVVHMGALIAAILATALVGDLLVLPALLVLFGPAAAPIARRAPRSYPGSRSSGSSPLHRR